MQSPHRPPALQFQANNGTQHPEIAVFFLCLTHHRTLGGKGSLKYYYLSLFLVIMMCEHETDIFIIPPSGSTVSLPLRLPVDWLWPSLPALSGANLWVGRQNLPELLLHGAGELQGQEPGRRHQEALRTLRPGVEEGGEELHL